MGTVKAQIDFTQWFYSVLWTSEETERAVRVKGQTR